MNAAIIAEESAEARQKVQQVRVAVPLHAAVDPGAHRVAFTFFLPPCRVVRSPVSCFELRQGHVPVLLRLFVDCPKDSQMVVDLLLTTYTRNAFGECLDTSTLKCQGLVSGIMPRRLCKCSNFSDIRRRYETMGINLSK